MPEAACLSIPIKSFLIEMYREEEAPDSWVVYISAHIISLTYAAIPGRFCLKPGSASTGSSVVVDFDISESDINRFTKAIVSTGVQGWFFYDHEMNMMSSAHASIVDIANFLPLQYRSAFHLQLGRDAVFCQMQVDLIGPGGGCAIFEGDTVGAARIAIRAGVAPMVDQATFGCQKLKHGSVRKIESIGTVILRIAGAVTHRSGESLG